MKNAPTPDQQAVAEQLRYHYFCCRQIETSIRALEKIATMRENRTWSIEVLERRISNAA